MTEYQIENNVLKAPKRSRGARSPITRSMPFDKLSLNQGFLVPFSITTKHYVCKIVSRRNQLMMQQSSPKRFISRAGEDGTYIIRVK